MRRFLVACLLFIAAANPPAAPAQGRDHPTPLNSEEISGKLGGRTFDSYYSFAAGPGELTVTVDVKSAGHSTGITFDLQGQRRLIASTRVQADGGAAHKSAGVRLADRETLILHLSGADVDGAGTFRLRLGGDVSLSGGGDGEAATREDIVRRPESAATRLYDAWLKGDRRAASEVASPEAVRLLFKHRPLRLKFTGCRAADGGATCSFEGRRDGTTLEMSVAGGPSLGYSVESASLTSPE